MVLPTEGVFMDQFQVPCLKHFNKTLDNSDQIDTQAALAENVRLLSELSVYIEDMLNVTPSKNINAAERELLGDYRHCVLA